MLTRVKEYLSSSVASIVCMLLAIVGRIILLRAYLGTGSDKFAHTVMAHNFWKGHGFRLSASTMDDLGKVSYVPDNGWPPVYHALLSVFMPFTGDNYMLPCFLADCVATLLFFVYCRKILLLIKFPVWLVNLFLVFQGTFNFIFVLHSTPSDFLSLSLLVACLFYLLKTVQTDVISRPLLLLLSFFLCAAALTRYQNIPVVMLATGALIVYGYLQKKKSWIFSGFISLAIVILACSAFLLYLHVQTGQIFYVVHSKRGLYPENLLKTHPFIISGSINYVFYGVQLDRRLGIKYGDWIIFIRWVGLVLSVLFTIAITCYVFKKRRLIDSTKDGFLILGFWMYVGTVGLMVFLSLVLDKYVGPPMFNWTYVSEARYYAFPAFFFQVCCWWFFFVRTREKNTVFVNGLRVFYIVILAIELSHGLYTVVKKSTEEFVPLRTILLELPEQARVIQFIKDIRQQEPGRSVVVTGFSKRYGFLSGLYGASGLFTPLALNEKLPVASKPVVLLVVVKKFELYLMKPFLEKPGVKLVTETRDAFIYSYYIEPSARLLEK